MTIPDFVDNYYLPPGEHSCTFKEMEQRFAQADDVTVRQKVWKSLVHVLRRINELGLKPDTLLVDGSFVTGRKQPGDIDAAVLIPPDRFKKALQEADKHDKLAIQIFIRAWKGDSNAEILLRSLFGAHIFIAADEAGLQPWSLFFRTGYPEPGLKPPDPQRDPPDVRTPKEKGILRIDMVGVNIDA